MEVVLDLDRNNESDDIGSDLIVSTPEKLEKAEKFYKTKPPKYISGSTLKAVGWYTNYRDPKRFHEIDEIRKLFAEIALQDNVSDITLKSGSPVTIKIKRFGLKAITHRCLSHNEVLLICQKLTGDVAISSRIAKGKPISGMAQLLDNSEIDAQTGARSDTNRYRYEITACSSQDEQAGISVIMRPLPDKPYRYDEIGLSLEFVESCIVKDGIVIIAGATGEGKSTTIASVIRYILENDTMIKGIILTHEDPIEVSFESIDSEHSEVYQSAIGQGLHVITFDDANRSAMRRSPDLVLLGELRDQATIEAAVEISLTGHPVFATTHASSISSIFPRLISRFPQELQGQKGFDLVETTRFLVAQKLIWNTKGKRIAIRETLTFSEGLRGVLIKHAEKTDVLYKMINKIMDNELFGAKNYESQGKALLENGDIDEINYFYLAGKVVELDEGEVKLLEGVANA